MTVVAPPTLMPNLDEFEASSSHSLDEAIESQPDVLMMLRVQSERMSSAFFPNEREYSRIWGLTDERFSRLGRSTTIMHPGPMNRGLEICSAAADSPQSAIVQQVANGISVRMAVLHTLVSPEKESNV